MFRLPSFILSIEIPAICITPFWAVYYIIQKAGFNNNKKMFEGYNKFAGSTFEKIYLDVSYHLNVIAL